MSRYQDTVVDDDDDDCCPLCIEEFDPSDKAFFPCPCGFQICQFCHNRIRQTGNGLCPNCRRVYEDSNIRMEIPTAEEMAKHRAKQARKKTAPKVKETQTREADSLSRKHLAGIRVRRQNLVYVTGLRLNTSDATISEKLRGEQFFGQYGRIDKIVVNKPKDSRSMQPVGVYITYFEKEAAALCIAMVNGTQNAGVTIRADYGTTKYCSAYLRGDTCTNRNCTFLHEPGEENESFTREDLSTFNARSIEAGTSAEPTADQQPAPPTLHINPPGLTAAAHLMDRQDSRDGTASPVESSDGSALPSTVSWANRALISRPASRAVSLAAPSPQVSNATVQSAVHKAAAPPEPIVEAQTQPSPPPAISTVKEEAVQDSKPAATATQQKTRKSRNLSPMSKSIRNCLTADTLAFVFDESVYADEVDGRSLNFLRSFPPLFDSNGGVKRQLLRQRRMERQRLENDKQFAAQALAAMDVTEEPMERGSLQLGGEPEERQTHDAAMEHIIRPPSQATVSSIGQGFTSAPGLTRGAPGLREQPFPPQDLDSTSANLSNQAYGMVGGQSGQAGNLGHSRQTSRFSFGNDASTTNSNVKSVGNAKLMSQQSSMMPPPNNQFSSTGQHQSNAQFYATTVQGPPPGLKATRTPPVSGGGMFGQGHGFTAAAQGYGYSQNGRSTNDEMMREIMRSRGGSGSAASGRASDAGRHDLTDPNLQARMHQAMGAGSGSYGAQGQNQSQGGFNSSMYSNNVYGRW